MLAALLHGIPVLGVSQTLRRWTEGATYIRQGGHQVGHWPTFLVSVESKITLLLTPSAYLVQLYCKRCLTVLVTTTPEPTPRPRIEYQIATWSLVGASIITLIIIASLGITLWLRTRASWQPNRLVASQSLLHGDTWCCQPRCWTVNSGLSDCSSTTVISRDKTDTRCMVKMIASLQSSVDCVVHSHKTMNITLAWPPLRCPHQQSCGTSMDDRV